MHIACCDSGSNMLYSNDDMGAQRLAFAISVVLFAAILRFLCESLGKSQHIPTNKAGKAYKASKAQNKQASKQASKRFLWTCRTSHPAVSIEVLPDESMLIPNSTSRGNQHMANTARHARCHALKQKVLAKALESGPHLS